MKLALPWVNCNVLNLKADLEAATVKESLSLIIIVFNLIDILN